MKHLSRRELRVMSRVDSSLILPGGANLVTQNGDVWEVVSDASGNWRVTNILLASGAPPRPTLTANRTYYVRTDGNDSNTGLANTSGGAFKTLQAAYDYIRSNLDTAGFTITIQGGNTPAFTAGLAIDKPWVGGGSINIDLGGGSITVASGHAIRVGIVLPSTLAIANGTLNSPAGGNVVHTGVGTVALGPNITFGTIGSSSAHMSAQAFGAQVRTASSYSIAGTGGVAHFTALSGGAVFTSNVTVTVTANLTFAAAWGYVDRVSFAQADGSTFSLGAFTVTGSRYTVTGNSVIFTGGGGPNYFPGNTAGTAGTGGQYL